MYVYACIIPACWGFGSCLIAWVTTDHDLCKADWLYLVVPSRVLLKRCTAGFAQTQFEIVDCIGAAIITIASYSKHREKPLNIKIATHRPVLFPDEL
jgi:hypothetical protein